MATQRQRGLQIAVESPLLYRSGELDELVLLQPGWVLLKQIPIRLFDFLQDLLARFRRRRSDLVVCYLCKLQK